MRPGVAVSFLLVFGLPLAALALTVLISLGWAPFYGVDVFPSADFYREFTDRLDFSRSVLYGLYYSLVPTVLGIIISYLISYRIFFRHSSPTWGIYQFPLFVPYSVAGSLMILLFVPGGILSRIFFQFGFIADAGEFPRIFNTPASLGIFLTVLWKQIPFCVFLILNEMSKIRPSVLRSASILNADRLSLSRFVVLPAIHPTLRFLFLFLFVFNFGNYEIPYILGDSSLDSLPVTVFRYFTQADPANKLTGAAGVCIAFAVSIATAVGLLGLLKIISARFYRP